jgi:carbamoyltransferase
MIILGISCYYHDSAAALLVDGKLVAAAQEERFTRKKHDPSFPENAIEYCLTEAGISREQVDYVAFYDKPFLKFERILETYLAYVPKGIRSALKAIPVWIKDKLWISEQLREKFNDQVHLLFPEHHQSHAASAFYPSPFEEAAVITMDGVGEWATSSIGYGNGKHLEIHQELHFPHSLGLLYSAFTYYTGFRVNSGEYKVMGLAPYGNPTYVETIKKELIDIKEDGSFRLNMDYFNYAAGLTMTSKKFDKLFDGPPRKKESKLTQKEMDLAASVQVVTEEIMQKMCKNAMQKFNTKNICLAGGVALNCVGNGEILRKTGVENLWIQPAAGDAGGAVGAAYMAWHGYLEKERSADNKTDLMSGSYLGPEFSNDHTQQFIKQNAYKAEFLSDEELFTTTAKLIDGQNVVGWFQGRMEFGPRALGHRSILGDPRSREMQKTLNLKIKYRESFRPFAPSVLRNHVSEYFDLQVESPYMLLVADVSENQLKELDETKEGLEKLYQIRSGIPAVTHVDNSARIQTVDGVENPQYFKLITAFYDLTGCPVMINTSFNVRGEPIVCTPAEAYACFMRTEMDVLVIGNYLFRKEDQPEWPEKDNWKETFELD